jgi:hypothetical protein
MNYSEAVAYYGGNASRLARELGMHVRSVYAWRERGAIPLLRQLQLEELSGGKLRRDSARSVSART